MYINLSHLQRKERELVIIILQKLGKNITLDENSVNIPSSMFNDLILVLHQKEGGYLGA